MGLSDTICEWIPKVLSSGATLAEGPLTALLLPEIGPAAPFVAAGILWVAEHTIGGLANFICDETGHGEEARKQQAKLAEAANYAKRTVKTARIRPSAATSQAMMREYATGNIPPSEPSTLQAVARAKMGVTEPIAPVVLPPTVVGFAPNPLYAQKEYVNVLYQPEQTVWAHMYERRQGTYNGQPNATFVKVGF